MEKKNEDTTDNDRPISQDIAARVAAHVTGQFLNIDKHIARNLSKHLDKIVMLGLGFEERSYSRFEIANRQGSVIVDTIAAVAKDAVKKQALSIFKKHMKNDRPSLEKLIHSRFRWEYQNTLLAELKRLFIEEAKRVEKEIERELSMDTPKNLNTILDPIIEGVRQDVLKRLTEGTLLNENGRAVDLGEALDLESSYARSR